MGRDFDLFTLVSNISHVEKRLTCLVGVPGLGKSSLVRNALHYLN